MSVITLLDGSIGQELVHRLGAKPTPYWSTSVMLEQPDLVRKVHDTYFQAGAQIASTNTYPVHRDRLEGSGLEAQFEDLLRGAVSQARDAADRNGAGRVALCLGPLGASYRPDLCPPPEDAAKLYGEIVSLVGGQADILLIETASSIEQAHGALLGCQGAGKPVWIGLTVKDEDGTQLRSGEPLADVAELVETLKPDAVMVNCSRPEAVGQAMPVLASLGVPFGGYANGFTRITEGFLEDKPTVDALSARKDLGPEEYADHAMAWINAGATLVGGCCEVGPAHIAELHRRILADGHDLA